MVKESALTEPVNVFTACLKKRAILMDGRSYGRSAIESDAINSLAKPKRNPAPTALFFPNAFEDTFMLKIPRYFKRIA